MLKPLQELKNNAWFDPVAMTKLCIKRVEQVRNTTIMVVGFWWTINGRRVFLVLVPSLSWQAIVDRLVGVNRMGNSSQQKTPLSIFSS